MSYGADKLKMGWILYFYVKFGVDSHGQSPKKQQGS